jgi:hypothetical protein
VVDPATGWTGLHVSVSNRDGSGRFRLANEHIPPLPAADPPGLGVLDSGCPLGTKDRNSFRGRAIRFRFGPLVLGVACARTTA